MGAGGRGVPERLRSDPSAQAAVAYFAYGACYLGGAIAALTPDRRVAFFRVVPWWAFYVAGGLFVLVVPTLLWRRWRRLALVLGVFVGMKALTLCWKQGRLHAAGESTSAWTWAFALVAFVTSALLVRAFVAGRGLSAVGPEQGTQAGGK